MHCEWQSHAKKRKAYSKADDRKYIVVTVVVECMIFVVGIFVVHSATSVG